jgi:glutamate/tyrosine decarboxylase-like PLP-dependent enzyme
MSQAELAEQLDALARQYGNRFLLEAAPDNALLEHGMRAVDAMRLIGEELVLDGIPIRNLATFVTTWMEPEAQRIIAENLHRNFIDHAEYPQTAEIEQRCIRMLADLFNAPGETTGARTQGSSEAIMLGALSLKWKWRERREQAGKSTDRPNLGRAGYRYIMETMQANTRLLAERLAEMGDFRLIGDESEEQLPLVAFQLEGEHQFDEFDVASQLAAERGWMVPAYTLAPNADHVKIMRALVKLTLGHSLVATLADDIAEACETLRKKGGLHELDRKRVKTGTGY